MTENYSDMPRVKTSVSPSSVRQTATSGDTVADDRHRKKLSSRKLLQEETAHDPIRLRKAMESAEAAAFGAKNAETDVRNFAVDIQELLGKGTEKSTKELESRISIFASRMTISNKKAAIAADEACSAAETAQLLGSKLLFEHSRKSTGVNDGTKDTVEDTIVRQLERVGKATRAAMESAERAQCQALECLTLMDETSTRRNARTETLQTTLKSTYNILSVEGGAAKSPRMSSTRSRMQNTHSKLYSTVDDYNKSRSFTTTAGNVVPAAKSAESVAEISSGTLVASSGISVSQNPSATAAVTTTTATTATTTRGAINLPEGVDNFHRLGLLIQHTREAERAAECASSSSSTAHKEAKKGEEICAAAQRAYENETDRSSIDVATNAQVIEKKSKLASTKLDAARRRANIAFVETVRATEETRRLVALTQKYAAEMDSAAALAAAAATNASTSSNSTISDSSNHSNHSNTGPLLSRASAALVEVTAACERTTEAEESLEASSRRLRSVAAETSLLLVEAYATAEHMALERHQREEEEEVAEQRRRAVREQQQQQQQQLQLVDTVLDRVQDAVISQLVKKQSIAVVREYIGRDRDASTKSANESISHAVNAYLNEALDECILEIAAGQKQELEQIAPIKEKRGQEGMMIAEGVDSNENLPSESLQSGNSSPERGQLESLKRLFLVLKSNYQIEESRKQLMEHIHHAMDANPSTAAVVMKWVRRFQARVVLRARLRCIPGGSGSGSGGVDGLGGHPAVYARLGLKDVPDTVCLRYQVGWVRKYSPQQVFMRLLSPSSSSQSLPKQQQQQEEEEEEGHPFILVLVAGAMFLLPRDAQCTLGDAISALWVNEVKTLEFGSGLHPTRGNFLHIATDSEDWYLKFPGSIRAQELRAWLRKIEYATSKPKIGVTLQPPMMATVATTTTITAVGVDQQSLHPSVAFLHRIEAISTHPCEEFPALSLLTKYITPIQRWWRDAVLPKLSIIRHQCQESSAVIVQRWYRHCMFRHKGQHLLRLHREKNAVRMQTIFRGYSARNLYKVIQVARLRELSAICIQTNFRAYSARNLYIIIQVARLRELSAICIQTNFRAYSARNLYIIMQVVRLRELSATCIQTQFRAYSARNLYIIMQVVRLRELSATCIQTQFRAYSGRMIYMAVRTIRDRELAAIRIQTVFRMYSATIFSKAVRRIRYRYLAAVKIQSWYRQQSILFSWHVLLTYRHECAVRIQTTYRTSRQQRRWCLMRIKVYQLQSWMRRMRILMVERRHQVKNLRGRCDYYDQKATIIQQWYHGYYKVSELQKAARMAWMIRQIMFQQKPRHIQTLQRWARYMLAYKSLRLHKKAKREERNALRLQCWVRQRLAISTLTRLRTQKQKHMRNIAFQLRCSQKLLRRLRNIRRSVIVLQCWMRMVYAKKRLRLLRLQNRSNKQGNSAFTRVKQKLEAMKVLREVQERQLRKSKSTMIQACYRRYVAVRKVERMKFYRKHQVKIVRIQNWYRIHQSNWQFYGAIRVHMKALKIQRWFKRARILRVETQIRHHREHQVRIHRWEATLRLSKWLRGVCAVISARKSLMRARHSVRTLQNWLRRLRLRHSFRVYYLRRRGAAVRLQAWHRGLRATWQVQALRARRYRLIVRMQAFVRMVVVKRLVRLYRMRIVMLIKLQYWWRIVQARAILNTLRRQRTSALKIQHWWLRLEDLHTTKATLAEQVIKYKAFCNTHALQIQAWYRGRQSACQTAQMLTRWHIAASRLQSWLRRCAATLRFRRVVRLRLLVAHRLQAWYRGYVIRKITNQYLARFEKTRALRNRPDPHRELTAREKRNRKLVKRVLDRMVSIIDELESHNQTHQEAGLGNSSSTVGAVTKALFDAIGW